MQVSFFVKSLSTSISQPKKIFIKEIHTPLWSYRDAQVQITWGDSVKRIQSQTFKMWAFTSNMHYDGIKFKAS